LEGLLQSVQLEAQDFTACSADLDSAWTGVPAAISAFQHGNWTGGVKDLAGALTALASSVNGCGVTSLAQILEDTASKLGQPTIAADIGTVVSVIVQGSDVTLDLKQLVADAQAGSWSSVGHDLGVLSTWLGGTGCTSFVCKLVEGMLNASAIPLQNLVACEADLNEAASDFSAGAAAFGNKQISAAASYWASGLNHVAKSTGDCGVASELRFLEQEANLLGFGNVTVLDQAATVIIHGSDFYELLYTTFQAFETHDYRTAGKDLGNVLNTLSNWTSGHACTSPACYVVMGIMEFLGDVQGDIKNCQSDIELSWHNITAAYSEFHSDTLAAVSPTQQYLSSSDFSFTRNGAKIQIGVRDLGYALQDVAKGVTDCHLQDLADILERLAVKLGVAPEVEYIEELLKILINGVQIENEIGAACVDFGDSNWVGFGYNLMKLIRALL